MARRRVFAALAVLVTLTACAGSGNETSTQTTSTSSSTASSTTTPSSSPTPSPSSTTTSSTTSSAGLPSGFGLSEQRSDFPGGGGELGLGRAVRVGVHDTYDRVVYEFTGSGRPGYAVRYVDQPVADPSGLVVKVAGDAYLEVLVTRLDYGDSGPMPTQVPSASLAGTVIAESGVLTAGFEAIGQTFIGVRDHQRPFRVITLTGPSRLVIDVAH